VSGSQILKKIERVDVAVVAASIQVAAVLWTLIIMIGFLFAMSYQLQAMNFNV
jgi:hypothetical protein